MDVIGEKHDQVVLDLKKEMSMAQKLITEKESQVTMLDGNCGRSGHICNEVCNQKKNNAVMELSQARQHLNPGFAIIFDNIDGKLERRHMSKDKPNFDFHWVNHKIVENRVSGSKHDGSPRDLLSVPNIKFLPSVRDQQQQHQNYIVLVARILVDHLECFQVLRNVCVRHIPHKHSKELAQKFKSVSTFCTLI